MPESMRICPLSNSCAELTYGEYGTSNDDTSVYVPAFSSTSYLRYCDFAVSEDSSVEIPSITVQSKSGRVSEVPKLLSNMYR